MRLALCPDAASGAAAVLALGVALLPSASAGPLGLLPEDTHALVQERGDQVLFIDVRDPVEIMFTGFTDAVDANIQ